MTLLMAMVWAYMVFGAAIAFTQGVLEIEDPRQAVTVTALLIFFWLPITLYVLANRE